MSALSEMPEDSKADPLVVVACQLIENVLHSGKVKGTFDKMVPPTTLMMAV